MKLDWKVSEEIYLRKNNGYESEIKDLKDKSKEKNMIILKQRPKSCSNSLESTIQAIKE